MDDIDLNLLIALDALLAEASVTRAANRLGLSTSAMSRTLTRLRTAMDDPLLVRAGRGLVPTPRAAALRDRVHELTRDIRTVLGPATRGIDVASLERTFTVRANEGFVQRFAGALVKAMTSQAPRIRVRFVPKSDKDTDDLREGRIDLDIGVPGTPAPETRSRLLFSDRFVGAVRKGHPLLDNPVTPASYVAWGHVVTSRRGVFRGPIDEALDDLSLERNVVVVVPGFPDAIRMAADSSLVALVPHSLVRDDHLPSLDVIAFELPVVTPAIDIHAMWHPRMDADEGHQWLRRMVESVCGVPDGANR
jgi:DNA-binding transcriptional LysR family regulator